jgi:threonine aldolase
MYNLEVGGLASTCGVQPRALCAPGGRYDLCELEREIHPADIQRAPTTLLCLENTFDLNRGLAVPGDHIREVCDLALRKSVRVYLDGARIFNAAIALGTTVARLVQGADVAATCLSKGLGCPVGSLLVGTRDFIAEARRMRQRLGGGWRQAGVLAAAGIVGMEEMVDRLAEDHEKAGCLAQGLIDLGLGVDPEQVQTNIVHVDLEPMGIHAELFCGRLRALGVKAKPLGPMEVRMVTHKDVSPADIEAALRAVRRCLTELQGQRTRGGLCP